MSNEVTVKVVSPTPVGVVASKYKGEAFAYDDFTEEQLAGLKGDTGDITPEAQALYDEMVTMKESVETSETNTKTSEDNAKTSETNTKVSEDNVTALASEVESNASTVETLASEVQTNADNVALNMATVTTLASEVSGNADIVATNLATITTLAGEVQTNADNASTSASNASISETNASTSASEALASKNSAKESETNAKTSENNAKTSEDNALASKNSAEESATTATEQATIATNKATEASASATQASESEANALASKNSAEESATEAQASADSIVASAEQITTNKENIETIQEDLNSLLYKTMTVVVDNANSDPETSCTYDDDAKTMLPGSSDWDDFFNIKPCLLKDGEVNYYLDPDDFTKKVDGTAADITSGADGDVMIEFPRMGLRISKVGNVVTTKITNSPNNPEFYYYAHTKGNENKDFFYIGAYKGYVNESNNLRSLSGKVITASKKIGSFRTEANNNGDGYGITAFFQLTLIQAMFQLKYKNLNSQSAVGNGYGKGKSAAIPTGGSESYGMAMENCIGTEKTDWNHHVKCFGIEDLWLNIYEFIDGVATDANFNILTTTSDFENISTTYEHLSSSGFTANSSGYVSEVQGKSDTGYLPAAFNAGSTTYYCDTAILYSSQLGFFGGTWGYGPGAGLFLLYLSLFASSARPDIAARLMFL